ncbi:MAG: helix-hairpin-helix domain-containing protein [Saprospiraceae bacterium]
MEKLYTEDLYLSKKERMGIIVLLIILIISMVIPYLWNHNLSRKNKIESSVQNTAPQVQIEKTSKFWQTKKINPHSIKLPFKKMELIKFDPNTLDLNTAKRLGISEKVFNVLDHFRQKGGRFRKPNDFKKLYGLKEELFLRLLPYIEIASPSKSQDLRGIQTNEFTKKVRNTSVLEINSASEEMWIELPGIGSKLAERIVKFKNALGGFYSISQIKEVFGINDSTFNIIKIYLQCIPTVTLLKLNSLDEDELDQHPYINTKQARFIVNYRRQHERIRNLDELRLTGFFKEEWITKIQKYLDFE